MIKNTTNTLSKAIRFAIIGVVLMMSGYGSWAQSSTLSSGTPAASLEVQKAQRQRQLDSTKAARKMITDSLAAVRKYRESKRFKDSVEKGRTARLDSMRNARKAISDAVSAQRKLHLDSTLTARKRITDSLQSLRQGRTDSLAAIRKYRESKRYKDSVEDLRQTRVDSIQTSRKALTEAMQAERQQKIDSIQVVRKRFSDSIKIVREERSDSLARIKKYKESKRYADSVSIIKQNRLDSIRIVRERFNDSARTERQRVIDSSLASRKTLSEALAAQRKARADSIAAIRKIRTDSLAKRTANKEQEAIAKAKEKEKKSNLKFELQLKKKRQAWSNEKMLKRKWSLPRQVVQNTFTRYNYFFNARKKMQEAERNMLRSTIDNYDTLLSLFPFDPDRDSSKMIGDMDSIIQKTSLGIQIHDPRTKWADDLYLLMGQAYYFKGDYKNAQAAFRYVVSLRQQRLAAELKKNASKMTKEEKLANATLVDDEKKGLLEFFKHQSAHNEAILWLARTLTEAQKPTQAESILDLIEIDKNAGEQMQARIALEKAYLLLEEKDYRAAQVQLDTVIEEKSFPLWLRQRATFLAAQLQERNANYTRAYELYRAVGQLQPPAEMEFYAAKNAAYNLLKSGGDAGAAMASMKRLLKDGKFDKYSDQVYYVLGKLSVNAAQNEDAITYFNKSITNTKATKKQKAITYAALGEVYYSQSNYTMAKHAYDSAAYYSKHASDNADVILAKNRAKVVDNVALPAEQITQADSLLALAHLDRKGQVSAVRAHIRALRKEKEAAASTPSNNLPESVSGAGQAGRDWYFTSAASLQQGSNDFKRKFGNRPLVDNWRRLSSIGLNAGTTTRNTANDTASTIDEDGLPTEESLLALIPQTQEEQNALHATIKKAYIDLATAYIHDLHEYQKGLNTLDTLRAKYPTHEYQDEEAYQRYTAHLQLNHYEKAQQYANILLQSYPTSRRAKLVQPQADTQNAQAVPVQQYYDVTYNEVLRRNYTDALSRSRNGLSMYQHKDYQKRFRIVEGIALAGLSKYGEADTLMKAFVNEHANDTLIHWANAVLQYVGAKRAEDSLKAALKASDTASKVPRLDSAQKAFTYNPSEEHFLAIGFSRLEPKTVGVVAGTKDFNTLKHADKQLQTDLVTLKPNEGMILVKKFKNLQAARQYETLLKQQQQTIFRDFKTNEYFTYFISSSNFNLLQASTDLKGYLEFYNKKYR